MLKVGLVGVGGISGAHIPAWQSMEDVELIALCDVRPEQMTRYPELRQYTDMDDMQKDFSPAADADSIDDMADDMIEMTDEEGNTTLFKILDYFFYNGDEYAILTDSIDEDTTGADRVDCYVMKIVPTTDESGEELEEFVPVEDQKLEAKLMEIATLKLNDDEQADDED